MTDWATPEQTLARTRISVNEDDIVSAQTIIELFANTTTDASDAGLISTRNLRLLSFATSFQAAWMTEHPDVFTNVDVTSFSQDGMSAQQAHANAALLAPLAKRCIDRLTWAQEPLRGYRRRNLYTDVGNRDSAHHDDELPWLPLP